MGPSYKLQLFTDCSKSYQQAHSSGGFSLYIVSADQVCYVKVLKHVGFKYNNSLTLCKGNLKSEDESLISFTCFLWINFNFMA